MTPQFILRASLCRPPHCEGHYEKNHGGYEKIALQEIENLGWASKYVEPGYQIHGESISKGVLFANWNFFPSCIGEVLEKAGWAMEWSDEWDTCGDCGGAIRTSPDCYSWQPHYTILNECEIICLDCLDKEAYLESIEDDSKVCCMRRIDPGEYGYERLSEGGEYENGLHHGQNDIPVKVLEELHARGIRKVVFRLSETSQFYVRFETWVKVETEETKGE